MHIDGDLLCLGFSEDYRDREPGFGGAVLRYVPQPPPGSQQQQQPLNSWGLPRQPPEWGLVCAKSDDEPYTNNCVEHGLFSHVSRVCADAANGLMW